MDKENEDHLKRALLNRRKSVSISYILSADASIFFHSWNESTFFNLLG